MLAVAGVGPRRGVAMGIRVARSTAGGALAAAAVFGLGLGAQGAAAAPATGVTSRALSSSEAQGFRLSESPALSDHGRYVAFSSRARNLVAGDTNLVEDIFVRDRQVGQTDRVSVGNGGQQANGASTVPTISADGRYVAFMSDATNLVAGDTNAATDVFVRDLVAGTTRRVSVGAGGTQANGASTFPALSRDGRHVAFHSDATNLVAGDTQRDARRVRP